MAMVPLNVYVHQPAQEEHVHWVSKEEHHVTHIYLFCVKNDQDGSLREYHVTGVKNGCLNF